MQKDFLTKSQQWLLTVQHINILKIKEMCGEKGIRCRWSFAACVPRIILALNRKKKKKNTAPLNLLPEEHPNKLC